MTGPGYQQFITLQMRFEMRCNNKKKGNLKQEESEETTIFLLEVNYSCSKNLPKIIVLPPCFS